MPTYEYTCRDCGENLELVQKFTDDPLAECPACGGTLKKVFAAPGIAFKGSGFYKTDSRGKASTVNSSESKTSDSTSSDSSSPSSSSSDKKADSSSSSSSSKSDSSSSTSSTPSSSTAS